MLLRSDKSFSTSPRRSQMMHKSMYVEAHPESMHVTFCDIIFTNTGVSADAVHARVRGNRDNNGRSGGCMQTVRSPTSVLHSSGNKRRADVPPSHLLIRDDHGIILEDPVPVLNAAYPARSENGRGGGRRQ